MLLFSGGPLTFIPALRTAFLEVLGLQESDLLPAENTELLPAMGAALAHDSQAGEYLLSELIALLNWVNSESKPR